MAEEQQKSQSIPSWERELIERLAFAGLHEQRKARRWSIFFKALLFVYLFVVLALALRNGISDVAGPHTAMVDVSGVIAANEDASADNIVAALRDAFEDSNTKGVILRINSPGGSPVQAGYVYDEIKRLRKEHPDIPLLAVVTDMCASGGYYIAAAADKIYADKASVVGSIGVLMDGFGFVDTMDKLGVERRLLTSGRNKGLLDPFSPLKEDEVEHIRTLLGQIHQQFIQAVKSGRGDRLVDDPTLFTGLVWTGEQAKQLGLVDDLASPGYVAREVIGAENIVDFTPKADYLERFAERIGAAMGTTLFHAVQGGMGSLR